jgi:hypothetical protein
MRTLPFLILCFFASPNAHAAAGDCRNTAESLKSLAGTNDPELRSLLGACLVRYQLDKPEVAKQALRILRDPEEDILLREDLIEAFADAPLRRKVRIDLPKPASQLGRQDREALDRTVSGAQNLVAVTQAMGSMEDTSPVTAFEGDFFRALNDIALDESNHVLLRAYAVNALEKISAKVVDSGVFEERSLRLTRETLRTLAGRDDEASYSTEAARSYNRLVAAGVPGFTREGSPSARMISSMKSEK